MIQFFRGFREQLKKKLPCTKNRNRFNVRMDAISKVRKEKYSITATCPDCGYVLSAEEIFDQFLRDDDNISSAAVRCTARRCRCRKVRPVVRVISSTNDTEVSLYPPRFTLMMLKRKFLKTHPEEIKRIDPRVFYSTVFHFGSVGSALTLSEREYPFYEFPDWEEIARPLIRKVPSSLISQCLGVPERSINQLQ